MRCFLSLFFCCSIAAAPVEADAQQLSSPGEAIGRIFDGVGLRRAPETPPDFVVNSRRNNMDYAPLSIAEPPERTPKKTPAEVEAMGADLMRAAAENQQKAARIKIPEAGHAAPMPAKPAMAKRRGVPQRAN
jgi:hypothetical protein